MSEFNGMSLKEMKSLQCRLTQAIAEKTRTEQREMWENLTSLFHQYVSEFGSIDLIIHDEVIEGDIPVDLGEDAILSKIGTIEIND